MQIIDSPQGSPEWWQARCGIPTGSQFSRIAKAESAKIEVPIQEVERVMSVRLWKGVPIGDHQLAELAADLDKATKSRKFCRFVGYPPSARDTQRNYMAEIIAERLGWRKTEFLGSPDIERGKILEAEARRWLAMEIGQDIEEVGFMVSECGRYGCSPDGLAGGVPVELKCPDLHIAVRYIMEGGGLPGDYRAQCHGHMILTGSDQCHFAAYVDHESLPNIHTVVTRNDYTEALQAHVERFCEDLENEWVNLIDDPAFL